MGRLSKPSITLVLMLLAFAIVTNSTLPSVHGAAAGRLVLSSVPPVLTSDNSTSYVYAGLQNLQGRVILARSDVTVQLSSSNPLVATVQRSIVIATGESLGIAEVHSTSRGTAVIAALAEGYESAKLNIVSADPIGFPTGLAIYGAPAALPTEKDSKGLIVIQLQDSRGNPAGSLSDLRIVLASSEVRTGTVQPEVVLAKGLTSTTATFTGSFRAGTTTVTASAVGYAPAQTTISVKGPSPSRLAISLAPNKLPSDRKTIGYGVVQILDSSGIPAKAPDDINVTLSSSRPDLAALFLSRLVIEAGTTYASFTLRAGTTTGQALITASTASYTSDTQPVTLVQNSTNPGQAPSIVTYLIPGVLSPDSTLYQSSLVIQLLNEAGFPLYAPSDVTVGVNSSDTSIVSTSSTVLVKKGANLGLGTTETTFRSGQAVVTSLSTGYKPTRLTVTSKGPVASSLFLTSAPAVLPASGESFSSVVLELTDGQTGAPARAPDNIVVELSSSATGVGSVESQVLIPAGAAYVYTAFHTGTAAGKTTVTATASGLTTKPLTVSTSEPRPTVLTVGLGPTQLLTDGRSHPSIVVQISDSSGNPGKVDSLVEVTLTSNDLKVGRTDSMVTIEPFHSFTIGNFYPTTSPCKTPCTVTISASASGFATASTKLTAVTLSLEVSLTADPASLNASQTSKLALKVLSETVPVANANVSWVSTAGNLRNALTKTNGSGIATATFVPSGYGDFTVTATVQKAGFDSKSASAALLVVTPPSVGPVIDLSNVYVLVLVIGVIGVAGLSATVYIIRRRKVSRKIKFE